MAERMSAKPAAALAWTGVETGEAALIARCSAGDEVACSDLVEQHQRMVYQLALHLLGDHNEALDVSQEVFLRVFRTLGTFKGQSSLRTWIYRIVVNQAWNRQRWWRRRRQGDQVSLDEHVRARGERAFRDAGPAPDRLLDQKETADRVWRALEQLPFEQRTAIVLREIDGLSYEEIAFSLGVAGGTVKSRLARAREALRAQLVDL